LLLGDRRLRLLNRPIHRRKDFGNFGLRGFMEFSDLKSAKDLFVNVGYA
jgi:hypothetical protein